VSRASERPPVCHGCSWDRRPGAGRAHAVWLVFFVTGVAELLCNRHAQQAFKVGGFGWRLEELPPVFAHSTSLPAGVIEFARPDPLDEQYKQRLADDIAARVLRDLSDVVLTLAVTRNQGNRRARARSKNKGATAS